MVCCPPVLAGRDADQAQVEHEHVDPVKDIGQLTKAVQDRILEVHIAVAQDSRYQKKGVSAATSKKDIGEYQSCSQSSAGAAGA